jgi:hypothetical protein
MTFRNDYLLKNVKGFDPGLVDERRATMRALLDGPDDADRAAALARIAELGRPLVLLLAQDRHAALGPWLTAHGRGTLLYRDAAYAVWLVPQPD